MTGGWARRDDWLSDIMTARVMIALTRFAGVVLIGLLPQHLAGINP